MKNNLKKHVCKNGESLKACSVFGWRKTILASAISLSLISSVNAGTITVATTILNSGYVEEAIDGFCSLKEAIATANQGVNVAECVEVVGALNTVIELPADAVFELSTVDNSTNGIGSNGLPTITGSLSIVGNGAEIIRTATPPFSPPEFRLFHVAATGDLTLADITLKNGRVDSYAGGAIFSQGDLMLNNITISQNTAAVGGGVFLENKVLNVSNSTFSDNQADDGGAIYISEGTLRANSMTISSNSATGGAGGGGIHCYKSTLEINASTISNNFTDTRGGGLSLSECNNAELNFSTIKDNTADEGGGVYSGGGSITGGQLTIANSTLSGNQAVSVGAGVSVYGTTITLNNSTVSGNSISANNGQGGPAFYAAGGSGLFPSSLVTLRNSTVVNNKAPVDTGIVVGGDIELKIINSIVANEPNKPDCFTPFDAGEVITVIGSNWFGDSSCSGTASSGQIKLTPLANNGGATQTHGLLVGSAAIDAGSNAVCAAAPINNVDQRGEPRPVGATCDLGAYEGVTSGPSSFFVIPMKNKKAVIFSL